MKKNVRLSYNCFRFSKRIIMHKKKSLLFQNILLPIKLTVFLIIPIIKYPTYFLL